MEMIFCLKSKHSIYPPKILNSSSFVSHYQMAGTGLQRYLNNEALFDLKIIFE